jgi:hypothetical protein
LKKPKGVVVRPRAVISIASQKVAVIQKAEGGVCVAGLDRITLFRDAARAAIR